MSRLPFHQRQLEFMTDLANHRIEWLNPFFHFLNYFDSPYFHFVLIPIVWLGFSYKWGLRIFYWTLMNNVFITFMKNSVGWPRPSTDLPEIGLLHPSSFGFPSGGAQVAMFLGSLFIYCWRTKTAWVIGLIYILLISFSRLYLGVHYPMDILGGWIFAWIFLALFIFCEKPLERWIQKNVLPTLLLSQALPFALFLVRPAFYDYPAGAAMGIGLGAYFSLKYHLFLQSPLSLAERIYRSCLGIALLFFAILFLPKMQTYWESFLIGLFMSLAASPICKMLSQVSRQN